MAMPDPEETPEPDRLAGAPHPRETARLFGQEGAEATVSRALASGRMHHAWLIRGPKGIGKATLAYRFVRALIAGERRLDAPPDCPVARRMRARSEPRLRVLRRELNPQTGRPRTRVVIDDVRAARHFLALSAPDGGARAVIVDSADEMTVEAANAFLKVLEEPPERTVMLLVSHAPAGLLPTIRSRCRTLDLAPLAADDLAFALDQAGLAVAPGEAGALGALAGGSVRRAMELAEGDGLALYARLVELLAGPSVDRTGLLALADRATGKGRETVYPLLFSLTATLLARLARAGALGPPAPEAAPGEAALAARVAPDAPQARLWAEAAARASATAAHAQAVNLDPGQTILDIWLDLDMTLGRATSRP